MTHPIREAFGRLSSNAIFPTDSQRSGEVEASPQTEQRADGGAVRRAGWTAMEKVHGRRDPARNQPAYPLFCNGEVGTGFGHPRSDLESHARDRRNDRTGKRVTLESTSFAKVGERHQLTIIRAALRAAALSNSDRDALDILGDAMLSLAGVTPLGEHAFPAMLEKSVEVAQ